MSNKKPSQNYLREVVIMMLKKLKSLLYDFNTKLLARIGIYRDL